MKGAGAFLLIAGAMRAQQSAVDPAGPEAHRILSVGTVFAGLLAGIFILVAGLLLAALFRKHPDSQPEPLELPNQLAQVTEHRLVKVVGAATGTTILILFGLVVLSVSAGRSTSRIAEGGNNLTVEVTGSQWWWHIRYLNSDPSQVFVTANEIHIPVGRPVVIRGTSHDVIHSFWVPNLQGKRDLIPTRVTTLTIRASRPGQYRGQCAEFCGLQHAHMALWIVAEPEAEFQAWMARQLQPATDPSDPTAQRGRQVFMEHACTYCH